LTIRGRLYNFGRICLSDCHTKIFEVLNVESSYVHIRYILRDLLYRLKFVYEGHLVKVKVTGAKKSKISIPAM